MEEMAIQMSQFMITADTGIMVMADRDNQTDTTMIEIPVSIVVQLIETMGKFLAR